MKSTVRAWVNSLGYDVVKLRNSMSTHLSNVLAAKRIDCVLDVGANAGQYGQFLREIGFKGKIVSFEPVAAVYQRLENAARTDEGWFCYNLALGDEAQQKSVRGGAKVGHGAAAFCGCVAE